MFKVSIIIPVYNTEKYLRKCLDSVCNQTLQDIEIICVNDCSPDDSLEILKEYASNDNRIKIINFTENKGVAVARNTAIEQAKGEYIGFVDSDDYVDLDFYEKLYNTAKSENAEIAKGIIFEDRDSRLSIPIWQVSDDNFLINPARFIYGFSSAIYLTEFIHRNNIKFPKNISSMEDPYFVILAVAKSSKLAICNNAKYYYRIILKNRHNLATMNGVAEILKLINTLKISKKYYLTIFERIYNVVLSLQTNNIPKNDSEKNNFLKYLYSQCIYKNEFISLQIKKIRSSSKNIAKKE